MEFLNKYKNILIGAGVLILVFGGFLWWRSSTDEATDVGSTLGVAGDAGALLTSEASIAGQKILTILNELNQLNIDGRVFDSAVFKSLIDYTIATTSEPRGRPDPFAPLPFESLVEEEKK